MIMLTGKSLHGRSQHLQMRFASFEAYHSFQAHEVEKGSPVGMLEQHIMTQCSVYTALYISVIHCSTGVAAPEQPGNNQRHMCLLISPLTSKKQLIARGL